VPRAAIVNARDRGTGAIFIALSLSLARAELHAKEDRVGRAFDLVLSPFPFDSPRAAAHNSI